MDPRLRGPIGQLHSIQSNNNSLRKKVIPWQDRYPVLNPLGHWPPECIGAHHPGYRGSTTIGAVDLGLRRGKSRTEVRGRHRSLTEAKGDTLKGNPVLLLNPRDTITHSIRDASQILS